MGTGCCGEERRIKSGKLPKLSLSKDSSENPTSDHTLNTSGKQTRYNNENDTELLTDFYATTRKDLKRKNLKRKVRETLENALKSGIANVSDKALPFSIIPMANCKKVVILSRCINGLTISKNQHLLDPKQLIEHNIVDKEFEFNPSEPTDFSDSLKSFLE